MAASPQDMAVYERVEIVRGANGLLHGAGNPAATVNLVPKRPQRSSRSTARSARVAGTATAPKRTWAAR